MRVTGINHVTLAVSEVDRSLTFYRVLLGFQVRAVWPKGAYLEAGSLWLCLSLDEQTRSAPHPDYSHIAFTVDEADFLHLSARLIDEGRIWKQDSSEVASTYFLDPDGHKLEIHVGSIKSRLRHYRENPSKGVRIVDG